MSMKQFIMRKLFQFFLLSSLISAAICILGLIYDKEAQFGYEVFLSPFIFASACILPTFVTYSGRELLLKELLPRKVLEFLLIEAMVLGIAHLSPGIDTGKPSVVLSLAASVLVIYVLVCLLEWLREAAEAKEMNQSLQKLQQRYER